MTDSGLLELSLAEMTAYTAVIGMAKGEDQFVVAFVELLEYLVDHTRRPYEVAGAFVHGAIEGRAIVEVHSLESFMPSFAAYIKAVIERQAATPSGTSTTAFEEVARCVHRMIEGSREAIAELMAYRRGASA